MKNYTSENIRNIALFSHGSCGKTSLAEAMLYNSGGIERLGRVDDGNTTTDFDPEEITRKISINTSLAPVIWKNCKINCLDTPGFMDFVAEIKGALKVVEMALMLVSAPSGVEVGLEKVWDFAGDENVPRMLFINKMDKENADFNKTVSKINEKLSTKAIPIQLPIGSADNFKGIIDILEQKAYSFENGKPKEIPVPDNLKDELKKHREKLIEAICETDEELLEKYLEEGEVDEKKLYEPLNKAISNGEIFPIFCGSAYQNIGVTLLLNYLIDCVSPPNKRKPIKVTDIKSNSEIELHCNSDEPFTALVFKTTADPYVGKLTFFRIMSGKLTPDSTVYNANKEKEEKIAGLMVMKGKSQESITEAYAGDIITVCKLQVTTTTDTLSTKEKPRIVPLIEYPKPIMAMAVFPKTKTDEDKMGPALGRIQEEDPTFKVERNAETKETVISGLGELHLDIIMERMKRKFGVQVDLKLPKVPYKETITTSKQVEGKYKRQSGGRGQYGHVWIELKPLPRGQNFEFIDNVVGGSIPRNYIPSVEKGSKDTMVDGILAGYPITDIAVRLFDGSYHTVDSSDMAFKIATSMALKKGFMDAGPVLLEPIYDFEILAPEQNAGDVMGDLNSKRGQIQGMEPAGKGMQMVKAKVPLAEMLKYCIDLRSITQGRGYYTMQFSHLEIVPHQIAEPIIAAAQKEKEEK